MIHLISLEIDQEKSQSNAQDRPDEFREALQRVLPDKPFAALSLSIPPADMDYEGVIYQLNKRAQTELFGDEALDFAGD